MKRLLNSIGVLILMFCGICTSVYADKEVDSLMKVIAVNKTDTVLIKSYSRIAIRYYLVNEIDSVRKYTNLLEAEVKKSGYDEWYTSVYNLRGNIHRFNFDYDSALYYYQLGFKNGIKHKSILRLANITNNLGLLFEAFAKWNSAVRMYSASASLFEYLKDLKGAANAYNNLGNIYEMVGEYPKSLDYHFKAYANYKSLNFLTGLARSSNNIANLYGDQRQYDKAEDYYRISLNHCFQDGDQEAIFLTFVNLGSNFVYQNRYDSALHYFNLADTLRTKNNFYDMMPNFYETRGEMEYQRQNYTEALRYYDEAIRAALEYGDSVQVIYTKALKGKLFIATKKYNDAEKELLAAHALLKRYSTSDLELNINNHLRNLYDLIKQPAKAYYYYQLYVEAEKNKNLEESRKYADKAELKHQYETEMYVFKQEQEKRELKSQEEKKRQNMIILAVSVICVLIVIFSVALYKRFKESEQQKKIIASQKQEVEKQHHALEEKNKEIMDSINYARRIQHALLAHEDVLTQNLPEYFVFFKPKDIVSGDFYWATSTGSDSIDKFYLAVCDSTGHGVPGAFMSLLNINLLNEAINEKHISAPNEVFNHVREGLIKNISQEGQRDGMDGILLKMQSGAKGEVELSYAAANNAPLLISNNQILELPKDKMPVGIGIANDSFKLHTISAQKGDMLYLYTDGYADQFGGPKGKKFKYKTLNELLVSISDLPTAEQKEKLNSVFEEWRGNLEQVDDVCIIGIRI